jgi:hypothetical protein
MGRRRSAISWVSLLVAWLVTAPGLPGPALAREAPPPPEVSVARPRFVADGRELGSGSAFFLRAGDEIVAVAAAHSFDFAALARAPELEFRRGRSGGRVAVSSRLWAEPGRSFSAPGATLRDDFVVFALDAPPSGVRVLEADAETAGGGDRVRIVGAPAVAPHDEDDVFGVVREASETRIEVQLDVPADLRGWGGAPVLDAETGRVVGILQAAWSEGGGLRVGVAPLGGMLSALARPLAGGLGAPFADFAAHASPPAPSGSSPAARTRARAGDFPQGPEPSASPDEEPHAPALSRAEPPRAPEGAPLLGKAGAVETQVLVAIEHPDDGAVLGDELGAFVAGRALAHLGAFRRFDVIFVLDTSSSASEMTGADVDGNGIVGQGGLKGVFGQTDPGDSILAAEVAAARQILRGLDPRNTRVGLVTFAGDPPQGGGLFSRRGRAAAVTEEPLTTEYARVEKSLDRVLERGAEGMTHMAAGVDQATVELLGLRGGLSTPDRESEKVVLFFTDGQPTLPYDPIYEADNVKAVLRAADRSARSGVRIHSFAIGPEALEGPVATVEMAARTGGYFTPVREPGDLVEVIENVSLADVERLEVRNLTTGAAASELVINADGSFGALVPLQAGKNRIEALARADNGQEARAEILLQYAPGAPPPVLPRELVTQRNRLLEKRLVELKRERVAAEREQAESMRREILVEIDRERAAARERAERQRKELELEAERPDAGSPTKP